MFTVIRQDTHKLGSKMLERRSLLGQHAYVSVFLYSWSIIFLDTFPVRQEGCLGHEIDKHIY